MKNLRKDRYMVRRAQKIKSGRPALFKLHQDVYDYFGGQQYLADLLGISRQLFYYWNINGMPMEYAYEIDRLSNGRFNVHKLVRDW